MFQKENIDHCYFDKSKNNILVTFYGDELKHKLEYKFEFEFLENLKILRFIKLIKIKYFICIQLFQI